MSTKRICDECRETTKMEATYNGRVLCEKCLKAAKSADRKASISHKQKPTKDNLIKMARKHQQGNIDWYKVIMESDGGRAFTNGHFLLSDVPETPKDRVLRSVDTLDVVNNFAYPSIEKVVEKSDDTPMLRIPKEFYKLLKVFSRRRGDLYRTKLILYSDGRIVVERDGMEGDYLYLEYGESEILNGILLEETAFLFQYIDDLKPEVLGMPVTQNGKSRNYRILSSHDKFIDSLPYVILANCEM